MGFPKTIVKAYVPPLKVDLSPNALLDTLQIITSVLNYDSNKGNDKESKEKTKKTSTTTATSSTDLIPSTAAANAAAATAAATATATAAAAAASSRILSEMESKKDTQISVNLILDVLLSDISINLVSANDNPILAISVFNTSSHLCMKGNDDMYFTACIQNIVVENRGNELNKLSNKILMSPIERATRRVQAKWRKRLRTKYPTKYLVEDRMKSKSLLWTVY
jgi:hypothetical protein